MPPDCIARWRIENNLLDLIFIFFNTFLTKIYPIARLIEQAGGLQGRCIGFHSKFISVQNCIKVCGPRRKRLAAISFKRCIDYARMYPPGFTVYITLGLSSLNGHYNSEKEDSC
jgi:hypothetical protein